MSVIIFLIILSVLVLFHEFGHFIAAKKNGVKVEEFGIGYPPRLLSFKKKGTIYSLNLLPFGGFVKVYGEEYHEQEKNKNKDRDKAFVFKKPWQKTIIIFAGVIGNILLAWLIFTYLSTQGIYINTNKVKVENVQQNSPAYYAGILKNDIIKEIKINNKIYKIDNSEKLISLTKQFAGEKIQIVIERQESGLVISTVARKNPPKDQGPLGVMISSVELRKYSLYKAPFIGLIQTNNYLKAIMAGFINLFKDLFTFKKPSIEITGPIGIAKYTNQAFKYGFNALLEFTALLSLNLAVLNVIPFPALDGGRLVFVFYEWISKKRSNQNIERVVNGLGMIILLILLAIITINDILKLYK
jgi:regulator of sigma E protease